MRPTSLAISGLKCWSDTKVEFGPFTAIQGPNGSGKTAIIQAIRLAMLGYDPETGKKLDQTRKLIAPDAVKETAEIGLSFENGFGIRRRFGKTMKTQVFPSRGETTGALCQQRIVEETGGLVVSLDLATFFDLSAEKRRAWLFEHLPTSGTDLQWKTFAEWTDAEGSDALGEVVRNLWEHNVQTAPNAAIGLSSAIETARREFLEVDQGRQSQGKVVDRGAELLRTDPAPESPPGEKQTPEGQLADIEERLASTNQRIGETRAGREAREAIEGRIQSAVESGTEALRAITHHAIARDDLAAQLDGMVGPDPRGTRANEVARFEGDVEALQDKHAESREAALAARSALDELVRQKERIEKYGPCPYALLGCSHDTEGMRNHVLGGLEGSLAEAQELADTAAGAEAAAREDAFAASERAARVRVEIREEADRATRRRELEQGLESKAVLLKELGERVEIHASTQKTADAELEALGSDDALAELYETREGLIGDRTVLQKRLEAVVRHSERLAAHERELVELKSREERAEALKELDGNLRRLRAHVIKELVGPLQEEANTILATMDPLKTFRIYFERENAATLDLGFEEDDVVRLFDAASKGERAMLTIAFLGALLAIVKPPMRLLVIDDLEKIDDVRRPRLMAGLVELADRFDAVIVAGACSLGGVPGWDLVDLEEGEHDATT